jgi:hypothetical protein
LHSLLLGSVSIDKVLACPAEHDLSSNTDLSIFLEPDGRLLFVAVIENNRYTCFCDSGLTTFVDEVLTRSALGIQHSVRGNCKYLKILGADRSHIRYT